MKRILSILSLCLCIMTVNAQTNNVTRKRSQKSTTQSNTSSKKHAATTKNQSSAQKPNQNTESRLRQSSTKSTVPQNVKIDTSQSVDLGLQSGILWAGYNIGAESPEKPGDVFGWGDVIPNHKTPTDKMNISDFSGNPQYDAATANWGGKWRTPTSDEAKELIEKCKWVWTVYRGVKGYQVIGCNGHSIFLPAYCGFHSNLPASNDFYLRHINDNSRGGTYWTSSLIDPRHPYYESNSQASYFSFYPPESQLKIHVSNYEGLYRSYGFFIRAVKNR